MVTITVRRKPIKESYEKVLEWFFSFPTRQCTLNDIVDETSISKTTANRVLSKLLQEQLIIREIIGKTWRLQANLKNPAFQQKKIPWTLRKLQESNLVEALQKNMPQSQNITLFGSFRKGSDTEESDLDIACEVLGDKELQVKTVGTIQIGRRKNIPVSVHLFSRKTVDLNVFNNIANGIQLAGFLEVRP